MMLRRSRKPATPRTNSTALSVRNQEIGTAPISVHLLVRQDNGAHDRDQDQDRCGVRGCRVGGKRAPPSALRVAAGEPPKRRRAPRGKRARQKKTKNPKKR